LHTLPQSPDIHISNLPELVSDGYPLSSTSLSVPSGGFYFSVISAYKHSRIKSLSCVQPSAPTFLQPSIFLSPGILSQTNP